MKYLPFILMILIAGCAVVRPPEGGPVDKTPPKIISFYPADKTKNFQEKQIKLTFSEYVDRQSVIENLFISPNTEYEYYWTRKTLNIMFQDSLFNSFTYVVTLGTDYKDLKGNKPITAFTLTFSKGNVIDSGVIKGNLDKSEPNTYIFAYKIKDENEINILKQKPDFLIPIGSNGNFILKGLKDGIYRLIAIVDAFKDGIYNIDSDKFSAAQSDIVIKNGKAANIEIKMGNIIDNISPYLDEVKAVSTKQINIIINEPLKHPLKTTDFILTDSTKTDTLLIDYVEKDFNNNTSYQLFTKTDLISNKTYQLSINRNLLDTVDNKFSDSLYFRYFQWDNDNQKNQNLINYFSHSDSSKTYKSFDQMMIQFASPIDETIDLKSVFNMVVLEVDTQKVNLNLERISNTIFKIIPQSNLENKNYLLSINKHLLSPQYKSTNSDSIKSYFIKVADDEKGCLVTGILQNESIYRDNLFIIMYSSTNKYMTKIVDNNWKFENVEPGSYQFEVFIDSDLNAKYSFGYPYPFVHSEIYSKIPNQIIVKKGWDSENIVIPFKINKE